jgi:hypothetical protein
MSESHAVLPLSPDDLLTTTRSVRRRLDLARPVARSLVETCLRIAFQAPNGSNRHFSPADRRRSESSFGWNRFPG